MDASPARHGTSGPISETDLTAVIDDAGYQWDEVIAVAAVNADGSVVRQSRGTLADRRPMSTSVQVYGASLTKQIVAMCIARFVNAGSIDPDAPISRWIADLPGWSNNVTVRHLLHHISGLPDEDSLMDRMRSLGLEERTNDTMTRAVATFLELNHAPGEVHLYSNIGYVTIAGIIEHVAGESIVDHVDSVVFQPLGMTQSQLWNGPERNPKGANPLDPPEATPHSIGDGGMWTTADDLTRWIEAMITDTFGARNLMMSRISPNDGSPLNYAWGITVENQNGAIVCSHGGGWPGSISQMSWLPERGSGFIVFTTEGGEPLARVSAALRQRLAEN
jgi:CubicO group peptidase (beta-lactamase class C family)